ncbi:MAG: LytTR family transcriptional regulator [Saprospiraceae bacterium]|nr:LytTR family transcriptional regulator [Candidatus Brachybacter algidus]
MRNHQKNPQITSSSTPIEIIPASTLKTSPISSPPVVAPPSSLRTKKPHTIDQTINKCLENLFPPHFIRVSKSNAVNLHRIQKINREDRTLEIQLADRMKSVGVAEVYYGEVMGRLG